jgi:HK97 family phage major capsid protein
MSLKALREKRGSTIAEMRALLDKAKEEKRDLTTEESAKHTEMYNKSEDLRAKIEMEERQEKLDREMAVQTADGEEARRKAAGGAGDTDPAKAIEVRKQKEMHGFRSFLLGGAGNPEFRALQADVDTSGGYLVTPEQFIQALIKNIDNQTWVRQNATVYPVANADALGAPSLDADPADADWTSELATGSEDSTMAFGKRQLHPRPLAKRIKVSNTLMRKSVLPVDSLVVQRLGYKFAVTEEKAFLTGTGAGQPLGVFTASNDGVPTSQDVSSGNSSTSIKFDGLISAKYKLKAGYWPRAKWLFHRDAMAQISKLVDGMGQYLWRPSVREGEPDMILGSPLMVSEYAPNTFTSGLYVGMYADWSWYWIADSMMMTMQRLSELYAETNQTGFIGRLETDGMPCLSEAFARVKLG